MSFFNHPLLAPSYAPDIAPALIATPTAVCSETESGTVSGYVELQADFSGAGLQDGDLMVVYCSGASTTSTTWYPHINPGHFTQDTTYYGSTIPWIGIDTPPGNRNVGGLRDNSGTYVKFWHTGDPEIYNFYAYRYTGIWRCIRTYVLRGISKRIPFDFIDARNQHAVGYLGPFQNYMFRVPDLKAHGDYPIVQWSNLATQGELTSSKHDPSDPFDYENPAYYLASPGMHLLSWDHHVIDPDAPWGLCHFNAFIQATKLGLQDLVGPKYGEPYINNYYNTDDGLTTYNCTIFKQYEPDPAAGPYEIDLSAEADGGNVQHWIGTSFTATEGQLICIRMRLGSYKGPTSGSTYGWAVGLSDPNADIWGFGVSASGAYESSIAEFTDTPDKWGSDSYSYSGIPSRTGGEVWLIHKARATGTHNIRAYVLLGGTPTTLSADFGGSPGADPLRRYHKFHGMAVGVDVWPIFGQSSMSGGMSYGSYDDYIGSFIWPWMPTADRTGVLGGTWTDDIFEADGVTPATTSYADYGFHYHASTPENHSFGRAWTYTRKETDTFLPYEMVSMCEDVPLIGYGSDKLSSTDKWVMYPSHATKSGIAVTNRIIHPYYYATEEATSITWGNYYLEATVDRKGPSANNINDSLVLQNTAWIPRDLPIGYYYPGTVQTSGIDATGKLVSHGDSTTIVAAGTDLALNDVIGIHLDFENAEFNFYKNGTLYGTIPIDPNEYDGFAGANGYTNYGQWCCYRLVHKFNSASTTQYIGFEFNFTGPFTYTKPTGSVALDWTNEVA